MTKICFLSLNSYPIVADAETIEYAGGAEIEYFNLVKELINLGYSVSFVTYSEQGYELPKVENLDGIEVIKTYPRHQAKSLNSILKAIIILKGLKKADADLYFGYGSPGILSVFSLLHKKEFLYRISSDIIASGGAYYSSQTRLFRYYFESIANRIEISKAIVVIAQTEQQRRILKEKLGVNSIVIRNGLPVSEDYAFKKEKTSPPVVLWVGSLSSVKQPQVFLELAKRVPEVMFQMIGFRAQNEPRLHNSISQEIKKIPNLEFTGFVPFSKIDRFFRKASLLVNTSKYEGFPMSFIQAWLNYTPTITLNVDPDGIIEKEGIGTHSRSIDQLVRDIRFLVEDHSFEEMCQRARRFATSEFDVKITARKYEDVFENLF